jgi:hypothetical protein
VSTYSTLQVELPESHVLLVTFNRPKVLSALETQIGLGLLDL